jgi:hypothetical protein
MDDGSDEGSGEGAGGKPEKLTPCEEDLLAEVLAAHPTLTRDEALAELRAAGMQWPTFIAAACAAASRRHRE